MTIQYQMDYGKTQTKMNDCWYACIQMMKSWKAGAKTKPSGSNTLNHRSSMTGQAIRFYDDVGIEVLKENKLIFLYDEFKFDDMTTLYFCSQKYGPLIASGKFGIF